MNEQAFLLPGERIDDLQLQGLRIIQSLDAFRFGLDAVLLADFSAVKPGWRVCDLGTGTGILPLLLLGRAHGDLFCDAVEIQPDAADRARRTMLLNGVQDRIAVHCRDLKDARAFLPHMGYDLVICNPPYSAENSALHSPRAGLRAARTEGACTFEDVVSAAAYLAKAWFVFMLPSPRLTEAFDTLRRHRLEPKRLRLVHANARRPARLCLIAARRDVRPGLTIEAPLIVKTPDGGDSPEIRRIYGLAEKEENI